MSETSSGPEVQTAPTVAPESVKVAGIQATPKVSAWRRLKEWWKNRDPHARRRVSITEEDGVHKTWPEEARAVKTVKEFVAFHDKLMNGYNHDYGTICHAVSALSLAGACLANSDRVNGGITGFQASCIMWSWLEGWGTGPKNIGRMLDFEHMLYPNYERKFTQISAANFKFLQDKAKEGLVKDDGYTEDSKGTYGEPLKLSPRIRQHWQSIVDGKVPFGWMVEPTNEEN